MTAGNSEREITGYVMLTGPKIVFLAAWLVLFNAAVASETVSINYVGGSVCAECHE
jgi:hypothetical protein